MKNIYQAIASIMNETEAVGKDSYNTQQKFKFRGIDDVMNTYNPILAKNGVFVVPQVLEQTREERTSSNGGRLLYSILKIKYTFYAEDGSSVEAIVIGEGMDSGDKASNKAMAVGMKYALFQVFCIPTEDMDDPDAESPKVAGEKKQTAPTSPPLQRPRTQEHPAVPVPPPATKADPNAPPRCNRCGKPVLKENGGGTWRGLLTCGDCVRELKNADRNNQGTA